MGGPLNPGLLRWILFLFIKGKDSLFIFRKKIISNTTSNEINDVLPVGLDLNHYYDLSGTAQVLAA